MTTQELKQQIDKVLGNSIRCLLPSYWWKRLFSLTLEKVDEKLDATNIKTINGESIVGEGNIKVGVTTVGSIDELNTLEASVGDVATVGEESIMLVSVGDLQQVDDPSEILEKWDSLTRIVKVEFGEPVTGNGYHATVYLNEKNLFTRDTILITSSEGGFLCGYGVAGEMKEITIEEVNERLKKHDYRFIMGVNVDAIDSTFKLHAYSASANAYIKGESWERLAKEGENSAIIIYADETSQRNADAFYKIKELAEKGIPATNVVVVDGVAYSAAVTYGEMMGNGVGTGAYIVMAQYAPIDTNPQRTIVTPRILMLGINKDTGEGAAGVIIRSGVDSELSDTSENPVQNKAIKAYVDEKMANVGGTTIRELYIGDSLTDEQKAWNLETLELAKQGKAIVRTTLHGNTFILELFNEDNDYQFGYTQFSPSGGVAISVGVTEDGLSGIKIEESHFDSELSDTSENAVQNKAIKAYVDEKVSGIGQNENSVVFYVNSHVGTPLTEEQLAHNIKMFNRVKNSTLTPIASFVVEEELGDGSIVPINHLSIQTINHAEVGGVIVLYCLVGGAWQEVVFKEDGTVEINS